MKEGLTVYWRPHCTSCMKVKEFLSSHKVSYHSVNIQSNSEAKMKLLQLGILSVPVLVRGNEFVYAQPSPFPYHSLMLLAEKR